MKASIIITSFNRPHLLMFGLQSLVKQSLQDIEIIVLNDGDPNDKTKHICDSFENLNIRYFSAQQKRCQWRTPGFAINFGVKQSLGEYVFLSCAEMYHMDNTLDDMIKMLEVYPRSLVIPIHGRDDNGFVLNKLINHELISNIDYNNSPVLHNTHLPFFMGMRKEHFVNIGGYDEDFVGIAYDDNDLVERLRKAGHNTIRSHSRIIHLYHERISFDDPILQAKFAINRSLYQTRKNIVTRNTNITWGENF